MSEGPRSEETAKLLKRANEENDDSAEMATKKLKAEGDIVEDEKKCPKKKVALLVAYSGKGYYGMQVAILAASPVQALKKIISCYKCVCVFFFLCFREIRERLSLGPSKMTLSLHSLNRVAFPKTMATR